MAHVLVVPAQADVVAAVDPPVPAPIHAIPEAADAQPVSVFFRCVCFAICH